MDVEELQKLYFAAAKKFVSKEEAAYFAAEVVETDIRKQANNKYDNHIIKDIQSWSNKTNITKTRDLPGYTQYDFDGAGPSLKIKEVHDELEKKAKTNGIAMVSFVNSGGMHKLHLWTQGLAKRGLFALGAWNGGPNAVVPTGGTEGILGTNPLTYGFPSDKGNTVVDMATSEIPFFKIVNACKEKSPLPQNTAVDSEGIVTTDAAKACVVEEEKSNLLPMGANYKGYAINYLIEVMTSALVGSKASCEMSDTYIESEHGGFILAIAIDRVTNQERYDTSIRLTNEEIRSQKPAKGVEKVIVPGDTNFERLAETKDIKISEEILATLRKLAHE